MFQKIMIEVLKALVILSLFLLALHLWPDEDPDPDLQRWMQHAVVRTAGPDGYHLGAFGFLAPAGEDPFVAGREEIEYFITTGSPPFDRDGVVAVTEELEALCEPALTGCLDEWEAVLPELDRIEAANAILLTRFLQLQAARDFRYPVRWTFHSPFPRYVEIRQVHRLVLARVWERSRSDDPEIAGWAWGTLVDLIGAHRRYLAGSETLIDKMVATAMLESDLAIYAAMLSEAAARGAALPDRLPPRLSLAERSAMAAWRAEAVAFTQTSEDELMLAIGGELGHGFDRVAFWLFPFQYHRTVNTWAAFMGKAAELSLLPPAELHERIEEMLWEEPGITDWMFNPTGTLIMAIAVSDPSQYLYRVADVDATLVLMRIAARAHNESVAEAELPAFLESLGPALRNPYDGSAASYADGRLSFEFERYVSEDPPAIPFTPSG